MLDLQSEIQRMAKPGVVSGPFMSSPEIRDERGYGEHFMVWAPNGSVSSATARPELDEFPSSFRADARTAGRHGHCPEPKLIFSGRGVSGIENTHVVTSAGLEQLRKYPDEITVL
jgi:hypothetical protein